MERAQAVILGETVGELAKIAARLGINVVRPCSSHLYAALTRHQRTITEPHTQHVTVWPWATVWPGLSSVANHTKIFQYCLLLFEFTRSVVITNSLLTAIHRFCPVIDLARNGTCKSWGAKYKDSNGLFGIFQIVQGYSKRSIHLQKFVSKYCWTYGDVLYIDWRENSQSYFHTLQALDVSLTCDAADVKSIIQLFPHSSQHATGNSGHSISDASLKILMSELWEISFLSVRRTWI
jgi:hypothetical protein